jgi:hypothetical protein
MLSPSLPAAAGAGAEEWATADTVESPIRVSLLEGRPSLALSPDEEQQLRTALEGVAHGSLSQPPWKALAPYMPAASNTAAPTAAEYEALQQYALQKTIECDAAREQRDEYGSKCQATEAQNLQLMARNTEVEAHSAYLRLSLKAALDQRDVAIEISAINAADPALALATKQAKYWQACAVEKQNDWLEVQKKYRDANGTEVHAVIYNSAAAKEARFLRENPKGKIEEYREKNKPVIASLGHGRIGAEGGSWRFNSVHEDTPTLIPGLAEALRSIGKETALGFHTSVAHTGSVGWPQILSLCCPSLPFLRLVKFNSACRSTGPLLMR